MLLKDALEKVQKMADDLVEHITKNMFNIGVKDESGMTVKNMVMCSTKEVREWLDGQSNENLCSTILKLQGVINAMGFLVATLSYEHKKKEKEVLC